MILKMAAIIACITMAMQGVDVGTEPITMEQIVAANNTNELLTHYSSVHVEYPDLQHYASAELRYYQDIDKAELQTPDNFYAQSGDEYYGVINIGDTLMYDGYDAYLSIDHVASLLNEIVGIEYSGNIAIVRHAIPEKTIKTLPSYQDEDYQDGDYLDAYSKIDAETLAILEINYTYRRADGTEVWNATHEVACNVPPPQEAEAMLKRVSNPAAVRTVTLIANPGTEGEERYTATVPKGEVVLPYYPEGEKWAFYTDAACTQEYLGGASSDEGYTLYCKKIA
jgi:hypothetical protein